MTRALVRLGVLAAIVAACAACGIGRAPPGTPLPHAAASFAVWAPLAATLAKSARGIDVDAFTVHAGELVRLESDARAIDVGERGVTSAETWAARPVEGGAVVFRAGPFTKTVLVARDAARRAFVGQPSDPGYEWFGLEDRVLAWAEGPLDAPFPPVVAHERVDVDGFAALGTALAEAVAAARDKGAALEQAHAVRRVAGLRAIRALRPANGYPYFLDTDAKPRGEPPSRVDAGRTLYQVAPNAPLAYEVAGPALLHVWARAARDDADEDVDLRIFEGTRERATSAAAMPRKALTTYDSSSREDVALRRAIVHVPPGPHVYRVEVTGATAWIFALRAVATVHIDDAISGDKSETRQIARARRACDEGSAALCAMAMALAGEDATDEARWKAALAAQSPLARGAAEALAAGGPRDPIVSLEVSASRGDAEALAKLGAMAERTIDAGVREAWARAIARGTRWIVSPAEREPESWRVLRLDESRGGACARDDVDWSEVGASGVDVESIRWHGATAIELLAIAPCDGAGPVELEVDGAKLAASPSAPVAGWHVRVRGDVARVRRLDGASGHVYALPRAAAACGAHWAAARAARRASETPELAWGPRTASPGVEVWLRADASRAELSVARASGAGEVRIAVAAARGGLVAIDERGVGWRRAARVALPAWASAGARVHGGDDVAVRAIARAGREPDEHPAPPDRRARDASPLDEAELAELGRQILARPRAERGPLHLKRALVLARGGALRGALADARAAHALGTRGPSGEDAVAFVRAEATAKTSHVAPLPDATLAYGVEADFDPGARRCAQSDGPRAKLAGAREAVDAARKTARAYDPALALRAAEAAESAPLDPRADTIVHRAFAGSRWRLLREAAGTAPRVKRPRARREGATSGDGELHARVLAGEPFADGTYVAVVAHRPAKAVLAAMPQAARARVDVVCIARAPAEAGTACPFEVRAGHGAPVHPTIGDDGRASVDVALERGKPTPLALSVGVEPGRWVALARVVFEREVPGSVEVPGAGWVIEPPHVERRFLLSAGAEITIPRGGVLRVDAQAEPGERATVVAIAGGRARDVPTDGTPVTIAVRDGASLVVRATGGAATVAIAERVANDAADAGGEEPEATLPAPAKTPTAPLAATLDLGGAAARAIADRSPPASSWLESSLGTLVFGTVGVYGTLREGLPSVAAADSDGYLGAAVDYRRRVESIGLWTDVGMFGRTRSGSPTAGAIATLYEDADRIHTRITGTGEVLTQSIGGDVTTFKPRAFLEYSWRATRTFFVLPRLGYDGFYTSLAKAPKSLTNVDDDVYNAYRAKRPTFAFAQALFWWTPFFNEIVYLRSRATYDPVAGDLSHVSARPGVFLAFGALDLSVLVDGTWYAATESVRSQARVDATGGFKWAYTIWQNLGSFALQPGGAAFYRVNDGGWQAIFYINVLASYRRGLRDFSSLELDFPEQLGGSIPWRGATPGGYR